MNFSDACHYGSVHVPITSLWHGYIARNMETPLEACALDDLPLSIIRGLASFVRERQAEKLGTSRRGVLVARAMKRRGEWLALQDIPQVIVPSRMAKLWRIGRSRVRCYHQKPLRMLTGPSQRRCLVKHLTLRQRQRISAASERFTHPLAAVPLREQEEECTGADDIFAMDQEETPPLSLAMPTLGSSASAQPTSPTP